MGTALLLHTLAATVWVGGMFFVLVCLRPAAAALEPADRVRLMTGAMQRFFPWVLASMLVLLVTGLWMVLAVLGGFRTAGLHVHIMFGLGIVMILLGLHAYVAPFRRLRQRSAGGHWADAGRNLQQLRLFITINLVLGLTVVAVASGGRYFFR